MKCYKITKLVYIIVNVNVNIMLYWNTYVKCLSINELQY